MKLYVRTRDGAFIDASPNDIHNAFLGCVASGQIVGEIETLVRVSIEQVVNPADVIGGLVQRQTSLGTSTDDASHNGQNTHANQRSNESTPV